ncbi:MAG TPA: cyclic nucleotide-binding domain-containing protein [Candidatus Didemnitutus sp.]|nr:cyclic nucleotide-binding domain-containing protein [Candidatus Didemnitutus sp.]
MEINLLLTAKRLELASDLAQTEPAGGVLVIKNVAARTYLTVTPKQWKLLQMFRESHTVPGLLEKIIELRQCPALGEYYELILKAVRARILIDPGQVPVFVPASSWNVQVRPQKIRWAIWILLVAGLGITATKHPTFPPTVLSAVISLLALGIATLAGRALSASLLRGAGGEVYLSRRRLISTIDVCMVSPRDQSVVLLAPVAVVAAVSGFLTWDHRAWCFFPLLGVLLMLRPILGGCVNRIFRARSEPRLSDAEYAFLFPLNRTPRIRWRLLWRSLRNATTWKEIGYGICWTLALGFFVGVLTDLPPWKLEFWTVRGPWLGMAIVGSLVFLGVVYLGSEFYLFARERAIARHETIRLWFRRWFGGKKRPAEVEDRARAILRSPLLRQLPPPDQGELAAAMAPFTLGAWKIIHDTGAQPSHVSLIASGRVGVYRLTQAGRRELVQVLCEDDVVGLHGIADPAQPDFVYRSLTPVMLFRVDWETAKRLILAKVNPAAVPNLVRKLPFLARIPLCQNWHLQAVQRFAELSQVKEYQDGEIILQEGVYNDNFFVILEGHANISQRGAIRGAIHRGAFFGEIGLLQNSNPTAQVTADGGARCLCIRRREFLRFVAHNYSVAVELERVSSDRLGYPIFPLSPGNFQTH